MAFPKERLRRTPPAPPGRIGGRYQYGYSAQINGEALDIAQWERDGKDAKLRTRFFVIGEDVRTWDAQNAAWTDANVFQPDFWRPVWYKEGKTIDLRMPLAGAVRALLEERLGVVGKPNQIESHLETLIHGQQYAKRDAAAKSRVRKAEEKIRQHLALVPPMPKDFRRWVRRTLFRDKQYCFFAGKGKARMGICGACGADVPAAGRKQGEVIKCPACRSALKLRPMSATTTNRQRVTVIQRIADDGLLLRVIDCEQRHRAGQRKMADIATPVHMHYMWPTHIDREDMTLTTQGTWNYAADGWGICTSSAAGKTALCPLGVAGAIQGDAWKYCAVQEFAKGGARDIRYYLRKWRRRPELEKLVKIGLCRLVDEAWIDVPYHNATIADMLRLNRPDVELLREIDAGEKELEALRRIRATRKPASAEEIRAFLRLGISTYRLDEILRVATISRTTAYLATQAAMHPKRGIQGLVEAWIDTWRTAAALRLSVHNKKIRFPEDVVARHDELVQRLNTRRERERQAANARHNKEQNAKMCKAIKPLAGHTYERDGLLIRPVATVEELQKEGRKLSHCVGGYANAIVDGRSRIYLVRLTERPDEPYFTVEVVGAALGAPRLAQVRGKRNCPPPPEVKKFVDRWFVRMYPTKAESQDTATRQPALAGA